MKRIFLFSYLLTSVVSLLISGQDAPHYRYTYVVSIQTIHDLKPICGGTLIAPDLVLTNSGCAQSEELVVVRTKPHNLAIPPADSELFAVTKITIEPRVPLWLGVFVVVKLNGTSSHPPVSISRNFVGDGKATVLGWNEAGLTNAFFAGALRYNESATIISDEECEERLQYYYTRGQMCTTGPFGENFFDFGAPLILEEPHGDVQIGVLSEFVYGAQGGEFRTYDRISNAYDFIREKVCHQSMQPPAAFNCSDIPVAATSSAPSLIPSASPAPSGFQVTITVQIFLDDYPTETGWRIETLFGRVLHEGIWGTYVIPYSQVLERVEVTNGEDYNFVLAEPPVFGDGIYNDLDPVAFVYLGARADPSRLLARVRYSFDEYVVTTFTASEQGIIPLSFGRPVQTHVLQPTQAPSLSIQPTSSDLVDVTIEIKFDTFPVQTSWTLKTSTGRVVAEMGPYSPFAGKHAVRTVAVEAGQEHAFTIQDTIYSDRGQLLPGNGICCEQGFGEAFVYFGASTNPDMVLVHEDGRFGSSRSHSFVASISNTFSRSESPSLSPTLTASPSSSTAPSHTAQDVLIIIRLDHDPFETLWDLQDGSTNTTILKGDLVLEPEFVINQTVTLALGREYILAVYDRAGNGFCCGGYAAVYFGTEANDTQLLAFENREMFAVSQNSFLVSPDQVFARSTNVPAVFSPYPSLSPVAPSPVPSLVPSATSQPTSSSQANLVLEIELAWRKSLGVHVQTFDTRRYVLSLPVGSFNQSTGFVTRNVSVDKDRDYLLILESTDGLPLWLTTITLYYDDEIVVENKGHVGFLRKQPFRVSTEISMPSSSPSLSEDPSVTPSTVPTGVEGPSMVPTPAATSSSPTSEATSATMTITSFSTFLVLMALVSTIIG